ncbi:MAG: acetylserotonin O-methyltransferase [Acidobacteria bacterium]|nr:acetylserotonin O-methyltransferase [Acidobacteriota bacterium]
MDEMPPAQVLWGMINSNVLARCIQVVAEYGVADALAERPLTAEELAAQTGMNAGALRRMLRLLVAHEVFTQEGSLYRHTPVSELLRTDHPHSMRAFARMMNLPIFLKSFAGLTQVAKTGQPVMDFAGFMEYFAAQPEESSIFNQAMADKSRVIIPAVLDAYDFGPFRVIADIGGGRGHLLRGILEQTPAASGILFDLPHVIRESAAFESARLRFQPGDFFADALPTADAYLLMEVIHDWNDEDSSRILAAIRRAAPSHARLLIIEAIVSEAPGPDFSKVLDVIMLAVTGGQERTPSEYEALLAPARFRLERIITTPSQYSIIEAVVV